MINAVIFDLDGVIIDSEPLWKKAEQKVFKTVGITLTDSLCNQTTGLDNISTVKYWYSCKPWKNKSVEQVAKEIRNEIIILISSDGVPVIGIYEIVRFFSERNIEMAVASSSEMKIIQAVLEKLKLKDKFAAVYSSEYEEYGKPHPAVYIKTARLLNKKPENCLVFEDSFYGALAAKSARMKVVSLLDKELYKNTRFDFVDMKINSFSSFGIKEFELINKKD